MLRFRNCICVLLAFCLLAAAGGGLALAGETEGETLPYFTEESVSGETIPVPEEGGLNVAGSGASAAISHDAPDAEANGRSGYNVVLAMDTSLSLRDTDPDGVRFRAVNRFVQILENRRNRLGAVSFATEPSVSAPLQEVTDTMMKDALIARLEEEPPAGDTNIGAALQSAIELLAAGDASIPGAIVLFSDGNTDMNDAKLQAQSLEQKAQAVQQARDAGVAIYCVCLNADQAADVSEMQAISAATGGECVEIRDASDLQAALMMFYGMLYGTDAETVIDDRFGVDGVIEKRFPVPGVGVDEINILIYGNSQSAEVIRPDGTAAAAEKVSDGEFSLLKVSPVTAGEWIVRVHGLPEEQVRVDLLFNTSLTVDVAVSPEKDAINPAEQLDLTAVLRDDVRTAETAQDYYGFSAAVNVRDAYGALLYQQPMPLQGGHFAAALRLAEGNYRFDVTVSGYHITRRSESFGPVTVSEAVLPPNTAPTAVKALIEEERNLWPFRDNTYTLKTAGLAEDADGDPLEYRLASTTFRAEKDYTFDGETLTVSHYSVSHGDFRLRAYDPRGAYCEIEVRIHTRNIGKITAILLLVLIVLGAAALLGGSIYLAGLYFKGPITIQPDGAAYPVVNERPGHGRCRLARFAGLPDLGLDPKKSGFRASAGNYITLYTDRPVTVNGRSRPVKKVRITDGREYRIDLAGGEDAFAAPGFVVLYEMRVGRKKRNGRKRQTRRRRPGRR